MASSIAALRPTTHATARYKVNALSKVNDPTARAFLLRKLFSLTGVIPLAAFTILHLGRKASALNGREAFITAAEEIAAVPFIVVFDVVFILLPLLIHALLGLRIALDANYNVGKYPQNRNWMYTLQRATGILGLGFIAYHFYQLRLQRFLGNLRVSDLFDTLCADLSTTFAGVPAIALLYVAGVAAISFHLANGLWGALCSWGITVSKRSQRLAAAALGVVGLVVFALGANTTVYFATGSTYFVPTSTRPADDYCPTYVARLPPSSIESPPIQDSPTQVPSAQIPSPETQPDDNPPTEPTAPPDSAPDDDSITAP